MCSSAHTTPTACDEGSQDGVVFLLSVNALGEKGLVPFTHAGLVLVY
jgi:hypothetical protein